MRTYGVNQVFRFVEGIWLRRQGCQILNIFRNRPALLHKCAECFKLPSYIRTMGKIDVSVIRIQVASIELFLIEQNYYLSCIY